MTQEGKGSLFELKIDGAVQRFHWILADVYLALDRPDRLEARALAGEGHADRGVDGEGGLGSFRPGRSVSASLAGREVFEGQLDRLSVELDGLFGRTLSLVAYAGYQHLRAFKPQDRYYQVTDSEVAARIASELGLMAEVERVEEIHPVLVREEDPLHFLRRRARARGFELAISEGKLYFGKKIPERGETFIVDVPESIICCEVEDSQDGRSGKLEIPGDSCWKPLSTFQVSSLVGGPYRAIRTLHRLDRRGYQTTVEFLEI